MAKPHKCHRINTKVTESDYRLLARVVREYKFRSIYQLVQTLVMCFIRHIDGVRDAEYEEGIGVEIDEMFDDMMNPIPRSRSQYDKHRNWYEG